MKNRQSSGICPVHQSVAEKFNFKVANKAIAVEFTDQQLSPHAGSATFWGWLHGTDWLQRLKSALPHPAPASNNALGALDKAVAFCHGVLCEARKLTHVAYLRRDPLVPELLGIKRVASQFHRQLRNPARRRVPLTCIVFHAQNLRQRLRPHHPAPEARVGLRPSKSRFSGVFGTSKTPSCDG